MVHANVNALPRWTSWGRLQFDRHSAQRAMLGIRLLWIEFGTTCLCERSYM